MKKSRLILCIIMSLCLLIPGTALASIDSQPSASLPLPDVQPFTVFDPNFIYLDYGEGSISYLGNGKVQISGETIATQYVDAVGLQLTLQRWTGTSWVDVSTTPWTIFYNDYLSVIGGISYNVTTGYYYRVKSNHWVSHNSIVEQGTRYSGYVLAS